MTSQSLQEIVCCFGQPVAGNPTQYMMEKAFARAGLDWRCLTLEVASQDLGDAVRGLRAMGFRGANLASPHKVAVSEFLDEVSEAARLGGAVNCMQRQADRLIGENTDGKGFLAALTGVMDARDKRVAILGAGTVARAIAVELGLAGTAEITIVNRGVERGQALVDVLNDQVQAQAKLSVLSGDYEVPEEVELLIHATSIGSERGARVPVAIETFRPELVIADVVYNPSETRLLCDARDRGCRTLDGLGVLLNQTAICFKLWTDVNPDLTVMRDALEEFLGL